MKTLLGLVLLISSFSTWANGKCEVELRKSNKTLEKEAFTIKRAHQSNHFFGPLKDKFHVIRSEDPKRNIKYNLSAYADFSNNKLSYIDLIVEERNIEFKSIGLPSGVLSYVPEESIDTFSIKLEKGSGSKVHSWGDGLSMTFSCK